MTRFLTPGKIGLLLLIEIYTEGAVLTASTIPILSFIVSKLLPASLPRPQNDVQGSKANSHVFVVTIDDFRELLTQHQASTIPGRSLWDILLEKLWKLDSLDALHAFLESRTELLIVSKEQPQLEEENDQQRRKRLNTIRLSRTSPLGAFVRRSQLEFIRLQFEDASDLWKNLVSYRHKTLSMWQRRNPQATTWSFDDVLSKGIDEWGPQVSDNLACVAYGDAEIMGEDSGIFASTDDIEKLLEFQIDQMQKLGNRVPESVQTQFHNIMTGNVLVPSLSHYVKFLDAWRAGDYPTSFDNLHRFFDYTMQNRDRLFYQYALLNLAVLQADFGCHQEAIIAIEETISTARENKDMSCLNFSLSWLYHFGKAHASAIKVNKRTSMLGVERESLAFLRIKAKESAMWSLWSSTLLSEAKMHLCSGESISAVFEDIVRSSHLSVTKHMLNNVGAQMMLQSSLWSRLGNAQLANSYGEVFLRCYSRFAPFDDILKFTARSAYLSAQKGEVTNAVAKLDSLVGDSLRSLKTKQYWLRFRGLIRLKHYVHKDLLDEAEGLLSQLLSSQGGDTELAFEVLMLHIDVMIRRGDLSRALERVDQMATEYKEQGEDLYYRVRLMVMRALLLDKCGRPQRGFSVAVRAANVAWQSRLLPVLWHAMGAISNILNSLGEFEAAVRILTAVIPRAHETEDCAMIASLYKWSADAYMGLAGKAGENKSVQRTHLDQALTNVDDAFDQYLPLEDVKGMCEMTAKKATIVRFMGDFKLSEEYAAQYMRYKANGSSRLV